MKELISKPKIDLRYEEHDPNLVKKRCASVQKMHKYLGVHRVDIDEGVGITCKELCEKIMIGTTHNG